MTVFPAGAGLAGATLLLALSSAALAQVNVNLPWTRVTAPGQKSAAVFMTLEAHVGGDVALTGASSPLARKVDILPAPRLEVPAGASVDLKPGARYLRLQGLQRRFKRGERIPVTLIFETRDRPTFSVDIGAEVLRASAKHALSDHDREHREHRH